MNHEEQRLKEAHDEKIPWKKWGPYLSERSVGNGAGGLQRKRGRLELFHP